MDTFSIDLNKVFSKTSTITDVMYGYMGTDSEPPCTQFFCWYLYPATTTITSATLTALSAPGVTFNNREQDLASSPIYKMVADGLLYTPPAAEKDEKLSSDMWEDL